MFLKRGKLFLFSDKHQVISDSREPSEENKASTVSLRFPLAGAGKGRAGHRGIQAT